MNEKKYIESSSEKKPRANFTLNYEVVVATYLDKINAFARSQGYVPQFNSYNEYKEKYHHGAQKAYDKLKRAYDYIVNGTKPTKGSTPSPWTYMTKQTKYEIKSRPVSPTRSLTEPTIYQPPGQQPVTQPILYQPLTAPTINNSFSTNEMEKKTIKCMKKLNH